MSVNTRVAGSNQEQLVIHKKKPFVFLTDFSFLRIQKRSYAEASRRVIPPVIDGLIRTNEVMFCILSLFCHVVRATWGDYAVAGHSENIFRIC